MPKGPGFALTFAYYFGSTLFLGSFLSSRLLGLSLDTAVPYELGALAGLTLGIVGTALNRSEIIELPIEGSKVFRNRLEQVLAEMGFIPVEEESESEQSGPQSKQNTKSKGKKTKKSTTAKIPPSTPPPITPNTTAIQAETSDQTLDPAANPVNADQDPGPGIDTPPSPVQCYRRPPSGLAISALEVYVQFGDRSAQLMSRVSTLRKIRQKLGL